MTFEYMERVVVDGTLEIDNIGECVVLARNDLGEEFYLIIKTRLGWTEVLEYGPATPDLDILPFGVTEMYSRFEYNQGKLEKLIDKFLNNPKRAITQAEVCSISDIKDNFVSFVDYLEKG